LQEPSTYSSPHSVGLVANTSENFSKSESTEGHLDETNPQQDETKMQQQDEQNLPSLEECLYGSATRKSPFIPDKDDDEISEDGGDKNISNTDAGKNTKDGVMDVSIDDDELNSRWSQNPDVRVDYHDIDMTVLRKLCSQGSGIPEDEGPVGEDNNSEMNPMLDSSNFKPNDDGTKRRGTCHRGVAWRILLEMLPSRDIHVAWPKDVPPQRMLYRALVKKYMENAIDPGRKLKGESHWQQSLRMNNDNSSDHSSTNDSEQKEDETQGDENGKNGEENDVGDANVQAEQQEEEEKETEEQGNPKSDSSLVAPPEVENDRKSWSASTEFNDSGEIRATEDIYDIFSSTSKYKELWRKRGIILNLGESAAAIGMNRLKVPEELLSEDEDTSEQKNTIDDHQQANSNDSELVAVDTKDAHVEENFGNKSKKDDLFEQFCLDAKLLSEIRKDVVRTNPHLRFYLETENNLGIRRHAAIERILYVWARLNDNLYVQGMNEIVGTMYYVLAMDPTTSGNSVGSKHERQSSWADHAEADTYFLFHSLMIRMEVRDVFVADLDHDGTSGLHARISNIETLLQTHDPDVFHHLRDKLGIDSSFYVIRWLTTLLSREFRLPDTIRLWDSLLASTHKENFLRYVCASMVMAARDRLLCSDFGACLKLLQNYPSGQIGMDELLESSRALWLYEMQISVACEKGGIALRKALRVIPTPEGITMAFGRTGPKPLRLRSVISPMSSPRKNDGRNVVKLMGAAKRLLSWGKPNSIENENEDLESWDLIDNIIDGKQEFVNTSMSSATELGSSEDSKAVVSDQKESNSKDPVNVVTPPPPPMSPFRFWNRSRSEAKPTTTPLIAEDETATPAPLRLWNNSNDDTNPTTTAEIDNKFDDGVDDGVDDGIDDGDNVVDEFTNNNDGDALDISHRKETSTNTQTGFWNRMRRRSSV